MQKIEKLTASKASTGDKIFLTIQLKIDNGLVVQTVLPTISSRHITEVEKAVEIVNDILAPILEGLNPLRQKELDKMLTELSIVHNQQLLQVNISLAISLCILKAAASLHGEPLETYLQRIYNFQNPTKIPTIIYTMVQNHEKGAFKEFSIIPSRDYDVLRSFEVFRSLHETIKSQLGSLENTGVALMNTLQLEIIHNKIVESGNKIHHDVFMGVRADLRVGATRGFICNDMLEVASNDQMLDYYKEIQTLYSPLITENPFYCDDLSMYVALHQLIGSETILTLSSDIIKSTTQCKKYAALLPGSMLSINHVSMYSLSHYIEFIQEAVKAEWKIMIDAVGSSEVSALVALAKATNVDFIKIDSLTSDIEKELANVR
jgi:enolase